ncbi:Laminin subunit alpha-1 [Schistosoma japonicum]|nr:Laminin subunit alpha-1 [Schistosoma japonicum]
MTLLLFLLIVFSTKVLTSQRYDGYAYEADFLDMDPDSILEENAIITANATCGLNRKEYFCRLVEHADGFITHDGRLYRAPRQVLTYSQEAKSYRDPSGQWIQCGYCDDKDPNLRHPIEYVLSGEANLWWQSPSLAQGLQYHAVTITMDFRQVYQIVYILLRMGDSPRPANWILERSIDGEVYHPWVFFAKTEYDCKKLYEPLINQPLTITSGPRPWHLGDDEVYCTTFYSQPQALQSGEIIVTLTLDRESTISTGSGIENPISSKLIDFLSARFVRLRFQQLQTLSGDWMAMPNQLDSSVYNRYYYSIRTIKVGGKCVCNSHASRCEQKVIDGVPRAVCDCQHNTCGNNCEKCCRLFNQQPWRPGRICEECNCNQKADECIYNQTVANLRLSMRKDGVLEGGGVCINCREDTTGVNCEKCKPGYYRPLNIRPDSSFPCRPCECSTFGSTGDCTSNDAEVPERYPGDCICKEGYAGRRCDECAEGFQRSKIDPQLCLPCTCDIRGSHRGAGYQCEPPCNCKINVDPDSYCNTCQKGFFNLDVNNPEGCQSCYCSGLTDQCTGVGPATAEMLETKGLLGPVTTLADWRIIVPSLSTADTGYTIPMAETSVQYDKVLFAHTHAVETWLSSVTSTPVTRGYYWSAPDAYLGNQVTAYRDTLNIILRFNSPTMLTYRTPVTTPDRQYSTSMAMIDHLNYLWLHEPDIVIEGNGYRLVHMLPPSYRESHMILNIPLSESSFRVIVEPPTSIPLNRFPISWLQGDQLKFDESTLERVGRPATIADIMAVLSSVDRLMIKAKYITDQTTTELMSVTLGRAVRDETGGIPNIEECICPHGHSGSSCESCSVGYFRDYQRQSNVHSNQTSSSSSALSLWRSTMMTQVPVCVPCECHGYSSSCDEKTGVCVDCRHNTAGDKCDICAPGFYGDPQNGDSTACKSCECPHLDYQMTTVCSAHKENLFKEEKPYICLDCTENTRGRYCEVCAEMHFGDPLNGVPCLPCNCGSSAIGCNSTNGACICGFNTAGPQCDACAEGTHGDPTRGQPCRPCNCHSKGSVAPSCRLEDGQCSCLPVYEGLRCDRCIPGRGNTEADCPPCQCDPIGTRPEYLTTCDPVSGQCSCKPGVGGTLDCSTCQIGYYNLGPNGCTECKCTSRAIDRTCDPITGQCKCGENVIGDTCDKCLPGFYWNITGPNCLPCNCGIGTELTRTLTQMVECDMNTGQCKCAPHVVGRDCTECELGYFGVSEKGCKPCLPCPNGQVCDQITGKCICPPNTEGDRCDKCIVGSWDYNPVVGCKSCNCSKDGSVSGLEDQCDLITGQCTCRPEFTGRGCDLCNIGYYSYPNCRKCDCDMRGTVWGNLTISDTVVPCNPIDGQCNCKENVEGDRCDQCKPGTFGLNIDYHLGCYSCFCFPTGIPSRCSLLTGYRSVPGKVKGVEIIFTDDPRYPGGPLIDLKLGLKDTDINELTIGLSQFNWRFSVHRPTHLEIPELKGSLMRNYGSVLIGVSTECLPTGDCKLGIENQQAPSPSSALNLPGSLIIRRNDIVDARMTALNGHIELEYQPSENSHTSITDGYRQIWLREQDWVLTRVAGIDTRVRPTRNELMLALLNVTSFSVRLFMPEAKPKLVSVKYKIYHPRTEITTLSGTEIKTIERCECPPTASGDHCEIASSGFYFPPIKPKPGREILPPTDIIDPTQPSGHIIWEGGAQKCRCHGMSSNCDPVTGICLDCTGNTEGPDCGKCAIGYMGDPKSGQLCVKCQCPTDQTDYAITCTPSTDPTFLPHKCICKPGYAGLRCEQCAPGYYGDPTSMVACQPCDCDMGGARSETCNQETGQCDCWPGIKGRRCDQCEEDHVVDRGTCLDCRGPCTGELLIKADYVKIQIDGLNITTLAYRGLARLRQQVETNQKRFNLPREQLETEVISRTKQLSRQMIELNKSYERILTSQETIDKSNCDIIQQTKELHNQVDFIEDQLQNWMNRLRKQEFGSASNSIELTTWQEYAHQITLNLHNINLTHTELWLKEAELQLDKTIHNINDLMKSTIKQDKIKNDLEKLSNYQELQEFLTDYETIQSYRISNGTKMASDELEIALKKANTLADTVKTTTSLTTLQSFDKESKALNEELLKLEQLHIDEEQINRIDKAKNLIQQLSQIQLPDSRQIYIPPELITYTIEPIEQESKLILAILTPSNRLNRTYTAYNAYQLIIDNMKLAENATNEAEDAFLHSTTTMEGQQISWQDRLKNVINHRDQITDVLNNHSIIFNSHNETLNVFNKELKQTENDLNTLSQIAVNNLKITKNIINKVDSIDQFMKDTKPLVQNASNKLDMQISQYNELHNRLQEMENRFSQIQGTAKTLVDRANISQTHLAKSIDEAELIARQLDTKLLNLRRQADEARSMLDVNYGTLSHDPVPLQLGQDCVYTLVPYSLTKSRVFDIEFWFNLHNMPSLSSFSSVLMVGRRAFEGHTQMFAFTVEAPDAKLRFSWNTPNGMLELGPIVTNTWYQIRVTSVGGETRMILMERPFQDHGDVIPEVRRTSTINGTLDQEANLIMDRQMELRIGGVIQSSSRLSNPEAWGDNGAEEFWSRLMSMESIKFCMFNLRLSGVPISIVNFADANPECSKPKEYQCQLPGKNRRYVRNGYIWEKQGELNALTNIARPSQSDDPSISLTRMFFYDFNGAGGYARLKSVSYLDFCKDQLDFQITPLKEYQRSNMTVMTFINYDKDYGITIELVNGRPEANYWYGRELYRLQDNIPHEDLAIIRRRRFKIFNYKPRWRRQSTYAYDEDRRRLHLNLLDPSMRILRLDSFMTTDCKDDMILFLGAIPPGHYQLRRRMQELGFSLTPFAGRIGFTNGKLSQSGEVYLADYAITSVNQFGDTQFTDSRQLRENRVIENTSPNYHYCLHLTPHSLYKAPELKEPQKYSPFEPGISMTVRFNPLIARSGDMDLLIIQPGHAEWIRIFLTEDHRLGIVIPGVSKTLFTHTSLTSRAMNDPYTNLLNLELTEYLNLTSVLPVWNNLNKQFSLIPPTTSSSSSFSSISSVNMKTMQKQYFDLKQAEIEIVITLYFGKIDTEQLTVLFDQHIIQSWTIPKQPDIKSIRQIYIGPQLMPAYPITIQHLIIGKHLVDFTNELVSKDNSYGSQVGICGGQLHPRYTERRGLAGLVTSKLQGLELTAPPSGRQLIFTPFNELINKQFIKGVSYDEQVVLESIRTGDGKIRRKNDCTENADDTAWFDQYPDSYWEIGNIGTIIQQQSTPFEFTIGFRAQLANTAVNGEHFPSGSVAEVEQEEDVYSLLAALNFGPDDGNVYVILSKNQVFIHADRKNLLWSSPIITITDTTWHRLKLIFQLSDSIQEQNGPGVENGLQLIFDHRHFWLPPVNIFTLPSVVFIGGLPRVLNLQLQPNGQQSNIYGLFGCVDQLVMNNVVMSLRTSNRPVCYDCFSLNPTIVHIPENIDEYLKYNLIKLHIPEIFLQPIHEKLTFDFSFFYDRNAIKQASLFVLTFGGTDDSPSEEIHLWLFLSNNEVKMGYLSGSNDELELNHEVNLANIGHNQNIWHYIKLDITFINRRPVFMLKSQTSVSDTLVPFIEGRRLISIHLGRNTVLTPDKMQKSSYNYHGEMFRGCIRSLRLSTSTELRNINLPEDLPGFLYGLCHTSLVW